MRGHPGIARGRDQPVRRFDGRRRIAGGDQPFDLDERRGRVHADPSGLAEEEVERLICPLGDQAQRLDRRFCLSRLNEIDRGPADVVARDLAKAETAFQARLLHAARPDLHPTPAAPAAAGGDVLLPPRTTRFGCVQKRV